MAVEGSVCARQEIESFLANQRVRSKGDRSDGRETRGGEIFLSRWKSRRNEYSSERPPNCSPTCTPQFATRPTMNKSAVCPRIYFPLLQLAKLHPTFPPLPSIILNLTSRSKMSFLIGMIQTGSRHCFLTNEKIDYLIRGNWLESYFEVKEEKKNLIFIWNMIICI